MVRRVSRAFGGSSGRARIGCDAGYEPQYVAQGRHGSRHDGCERRESYPDCNGCLWKCRWRRERDSFFRSSFRLCKLLIMLIATWAKAARNAYRRHNLGTRDWGQSKTVRCPFRYRSSNGIHISSSQLVFRFSSPFSFYFSVAVRVHVLVAVARKAGASMDPAGHRPPACPDQ